MQQLSFAVRPEDAGVSSQGILDYIAAREEAGIEHHAIWVLRHGQVACRLGYAPYDDQTPHMLFSLSKSFCSAAAGFAVQEGLLKWDTRLIDMLPEKFPEESSRWLQAITLHDLLIMGSGLKPESDNVGGEDWAKAVLACECDHEPGTHFHYNSHGTYLVSCMVQRVTGMTVRDYLVPRLFEPLGMMNADGSAPEWDSCPAGVNVGGWGLWLSCAQIAPFGQCLLQRGKWDGVQVLPEEWFRRAVVRQIDNSNGSPDPNNSWAAGYGYQFWMCPGETEEGFIPRYRGDGAFAQLCVVDEKRDMAVVCVSGVPDIGKALGLMYEHLFPAADLPAADEAAQAELQARLAELALPWPENDGSAAAEGDFFLEEENRQVLSIGPEGVRVELEGETVQMPVGKAVRQGRLMGCCGWKEGVLHILVRVMNAPFTVRVEVRFAGDEAEFIQKGVGPEAKTTLLRRR